MNKPRCTSTWQQMPSEPVIRCARREGHDWLHFNTKAQRQWTQAEAITVTPKHTVGGKSDGPWPYGTTHDYDCPACLASGSSFTASPRSETYWSS